MHHVCVQYVRRAGEKERRKKEGSKVQIGSRPRYRYVRAYTTLHGSTIHRDGVDIYPI